MAANSVEINKKSISFKYRRENTYLNAMLQKLQIKNSRSHSRDLNIYKMKQNDIYSTKEISYFEPSKLSSEKLVNSETEKLRR